MRLWRRFISLFRRPVRDPASPADPLDLFRPLGALSQFDAYLVVNI